MCKLDKILGFFDHCSFLFNFFYKQRAYLTNLKRQQLSMNEDNSLNLSIQLEENEERKQQELDEFVQLTKKIAESDRNNDLLREIKRSKLAQASKIRAAYGEVQEEKESLRGRYNEVSESLKEERLSKIRRNQELEELSGRFQMLAKKERNVEEQSSSLGKDNDRLEKQILSIQNDYEELLRKNKEKEVVLAKIRRQKQQQENEIKESEDMINELELKCERSKIKAEGLEQELKRQTEINQSLEKEVMRKQQELQKQRREKEDTLKRQEQIKKANSKLALKAKDIESEIDLKLIQLRKAQAVRENFESDFERLVQSQRNYEKMLAKRSQILIQMKKNCEKVRKQKISDKQ